MLILNIHRHFLQLTAGQFSAYRSLPTVTWLVRSETPPSRRFEIFWFVRLRLSQQCVFQINLRIHLVGKQTYIYVWLVHLHRNNIIYTILLFPLHFTFLKPIPQYWWHWSYGPVKISTWLEFDSMWTYSGNRNSWHTELRLVVPQNDHGYDSHQGI